MYTCGFMLYAQLESGYGSQSSLRRHGSAVSIASNTMSTTSTSSFRKGRGLKVKLAELETYRDILVQQIETIQKYFDACATFGASNSTNIPRDSESSLTSGDDSTFPIPPPNGEFFFYFVARKTFSVAQFCKFFWQVLESYVVCEILMHI